MPININGSSTYIGSNSPTAKTTQTAYERVSSGKRINSAADDAAGLAIASRFSREISGASIAARNAGDGISLLQVADGALNSINENLARIRELALRSANGSLNDQDRQALNAEATQLQEENQNILEKTNFNGVSLFNDDQNVSFQTGTSAGDQLAVPGSNLAQSLADLGLNDVDIGTQAGASQALGILDQASEQVVSRASELGAVSNRLTSTIDALDQTRISEIEARSRIEDADLAKELAGLSAARVQEQVQVAVQSQANADKSFVLKLLQ